MKIYFEEHSAIDYAHYKFPYCVYAIKNPNDSYQEIYDNGFLPYTNDLAIEEEIYYLARSIRIDLQTTLFNSKQKNVLNKFAKEFDEERLSFTLIPKEHLSSNKVFLKWCLENAKNNFLSPRRLQYILARPYLKKILAIRYNDKVLAYLFIVSEANNFLHVWYSFYDLSTTFNDFGKWILLQSLKWSNCHGFKYYYIGTCYSKSALYKLTLSPFTTYFNGKTWLPEISELKKRLLEEKPAVQHFEKK